MVVVLILLTLVAMLLAVYWLSRQAQPRPPETPAPALETPPAALPAPASTADPATSAHMKMQSLQEGLSSAIDDSAHPRDLHDRPSFRDAVAVLADAQTPLEIVIDYAIGANEAAATAALAALSERADRDLAAATLQSHFRHLGPWPMYFAMRTLSKLRERPPVGAAALHLVEWRTNNPLVPGFFAEYFTERATLGDPSEFGDALQGLQPDELEAVDDFLQKVRHASATELLAQLKAWRRATLDRRHLQGFGRFWEDDLEQRLLVAHSPIEEQLAIAEACVRHRPPRSLLVVADARTGKTSFLKLLSARMRADGWAVFEAGAASLAAGQMYVGQLEERVQRLAMDLAAEKRVLWYVPDLLQLAQSGTHRGQAASMLDQVFPAIAAGRVALVSESSPAGLIKLLQLKPALRSALEVVRLRALSEKEVHALATRFGAQLREHLGVSLSAAALESAAHLARQYLGTAQMPGALIDLLKLAAQNTAAADRSEIGIDNLLATLGQLTGMPPSVLDDRQRMDLQPVRDFFNARVIGQDEAVATIVDRIAMLKAGLTDPGRPTGVFLLAGPTGTGKTELAKTLAAFLFGSTERLLRLDMSEYQDSASTRKIIGDSGADSEIESLTQRIRKQPFAVVLLDEFEKAHPNVWDLFLQVFDDGRLTDASGHTADFRHAIIILTSNLGATAHQHSGVGFLPGAASFSRDQVLRAVNQTFRPEFVNRIDSIIVFRPLTRALMRDILAKELRLVLERRGLKHREWAVEWEDSALEFLLDKGFTPSMGARPLKRAIDQYLLAPLAATIVEHRFPVGDQFLFVRSDGAQIQVEFVDPDEPAPVAHAPQVREGAPRHTPARLVLHAAGTIEERNALHTRLADIETVLAGADWDAHRTAQLDQMNAPDFWNRADRHQVLARYALLDRLRAAASTARGLQERLDRGAHKSGRYSRDLIGRLAAQLYVVESGMADVSAHAPVEVVVSVQPAMEAQSDGDAALQWSAQVLHMYRRWAAQRRMQCTEATLPGGAALVVSGFGAARTLQAEEGLHVRESEHDAGERAVVRVKVAASPMGEDAAERRLAALNSALDRSPALTVVVRRYRLGSAPLIRDAKRGWRTGRADLVLDGNFDLLADTLT
jgi:ATP-dependent Clp protease ATP-binding subunit ClpC